MTVEKKDGTTSQTTVGRRVWGDGQIVIYSIGGGGGKARTCCQCGAGSDRYTRLYPCGGGDYLCGPCYGDLQEHRKNGMECDFWG